MTDFGPLFTPVRIGPWEARNRFVMAGMNTNFGDNDGYVTDLAVEYYRRRAAGGVGTIVVQLTPVSPEGRARPQQFRLDDDRFVPGMARLASVIRAHGARSLLQVGHGGRQVSSAVSGYQPVAPSPLPGALVGEVPRELTLPEIARLEERFAEAVVRAGRAGFDGIELQVCHGYLIHSFLSPLSNRREDEYGGDLAGRRRFLERILLRIRERVGPGFAITARISGDDFVAGGLGLEDNVDLVRWMEGLGVVAVDVSAGVYDTFERVVPSMDFPRGCHRYLARRIREAVSMPVMAAGRINTPEAAMAVVEAGDADLVVVGRAVIADPLFVSRIQEGETDRIRPCTGCNECIDRLLTARSMRCSVNPEVGREDRLARPAPAPGRRVLVVGAGPAGLEAAASAGVRGHSVEVIEREDHVGGRLAALARAPHRGELALYVDYLEREARRLGVALRTGVESGAAEEAIAAADVVVLATGGAREPVLDTRPYTAHNWEVLTVDEVLLGAVPRSGSVVVYGSSLAACAAAELLDARGRSVTLLAGDSDLATETGYVIRKLLLQRLAASALTVRLNVRVVEVRPEALRVEARTRVGDRLQNGVFRLGGPRVRRLVGQASIWPACRGVVQSLLDWSVDRGLRLALRPFLPVGKPDGRSAAPWVPGGSLVVDLAVGADRRRPDWLRGFKGEIRTVGAAAGHCRLEDAVADGVRAGSTLGR